MRYLYLLALCACFSLVACKKSKFIINGIGDAKVMRDSSVMLPLAIEQDKGDQEQVTLSVIGLPEKVEYTFSPASGTPDFGTVLTIKAKYNATPGTYPIKIKGTNAAGYEKEYDLNLTIDNNDACRVSLYGTWLFANKNSQWCPNPSPGIEILRDYLDNNRILIKYSGQNWVDTARVNCSNNTLYAADVPGGTFTDNKIIFTSEYRGDTCRFEYVKQ